MPARAIWKGVITFGRLEVPVKLYSAVRDRAVRFSLLHDQDMEPVRQVMVDRETGKPVEREHTRKGVEVAPGSFVIVKDEDLATLEPEASRDIVVEQFVDSSAVSSEWFERPYYLGPDGPDAHADYLALAQALTTTKKEGIARWVMRKRTYVGALRAEHGRLMLITLRHPDEIISSDDLQAPTGRKADAKELKMAEQLVAALEDTFKPADYHDEYRQRVMELLEKKSKGQKITLHKPVEKKATTKSLEQVLKASIEAARSRGEREPVTTHTPHKPRPRGRRSSHGR